MKFFIFNLFFTKNFDIIVIEEVTMAVKSTICFCYFFSITIITFLYL